MAVLDQYTDSNITGNVVTKLLKAINSGSGSPLRAFFATFELAAADDNASVFRVFKSLDASLIPLCIMVANDTGLTGSNDWDLGFYKPDVGVVVEVDILADGMDLSTAHASLNPKTALDGMVSVPIENNGKRIFEHCGHTDATKLGSYDMALTANAAGSVAGTISVLMIAAQG